VGGVPSSSPTTSPSPEVALGLPVLGPSAAVESPPVRPAKFVLAADPGAATVPVGVAVGLGIAGLATGFIVALGATGRLGKRAGI
jgi:hypothetical protein